MPLKMQSRQSLIARYPEAFRTDHPINPEVCQRVLLDIKEILDARGIRFWLWFGTFLGVYREGTLIPWDHDVDLAVYAEDMVKIASCADLFAEKGLEFAPEPDPVFYRDGEHIDLYVFHAEGSNRVYGHYRINENAFETPNWVQFLGQSWRIPSNPEKWLAYLYGPDWRTPINFTQRIGRVLFVVEQFAGGNPERGLSNKIVAIEALRDTRFALDIVNFYFDQLAKQAGPHMGNILLEICAGHRPDLVIFFPMGVLDIDPSRVVINTISQLGIKVLLVQTDSTGPEGHRDNSSWFPFVDYITFWDSTLGHLGYGQNPKAIQGLPPLNVNYFHDKKLKRDIDVSFVGSIGNWPRRAEYIQFLQEHGINIVTRGGQGFDRLEWGEYSDIISRSKISLNFCLNGNGYSHLKARVFEVTASRTLLLEDEGTETKEFFEEGKDFVMCHSKEEMLEKVRYYLKHDEERERIAKSGYRKATELYNARNIWGYLLSKMGFEIPGLAEDRHYRKLYKKLGSLRWRLIPTQ